MKHRHDDVADAKRVPQASRPCSSRSHGRGGRETLAHPFGNCPIHLIDAPALHHNPADWRWFAAIPKYYFNFWVLWDGAVELRFSGEPIRRSRPSYFFLPPGTRCEAVNAGGRPAINFSLHIATRCIDPKWARANLESTWGAPVRHFESFAYLAGRCVESWNRGDRQHREYARSLAHALLVHFWIDVSTPPDLAHREKLFDLANRIRLRPGDPWRIGVMAKDSGCSRSQFTRRFGEAVGIAPRDFLTGCRMERAKAFLRESDMRVTEIASALGYGDVYFFSRHFKRHTGASPLTFRKTDASHGGLLHEKPRSRRQQPVGLRPRAETKP
jgi:AraC-like DNA-binding protein